jgi:hypothetical protein
VAAELAQSDFARQRFAVKLIGKGVHQGFCRVFADKVADLEQSWHYYQCKSGGVDIVVGHAGKKLALPEKITVFTAAGDYGKGTFTEFSRFLSQFMIALEIVFDVFQ